MNELVEGMTDKKGGYWQKYPRNLFIQILENKGGEATTAEITTEAGCSRETTRLKMHDLQDDNLVISNKIGPTILWQLVDE